MGEHQNRRSGQLRWGDEPIAKILSIVPPSCYSAKARPPSARTIFETEHKQQSPRVWDQSYKDGLRMARYTVGRLMSEMGLQGSRRRRVPTTKGDDRLDRSADLVARQFRAPAPNRLRVADLTQVKTHSGWVYVELIVDVCSRMIVGWQASGSLRSNLAIDVLEMAVFNRRPAGADLSHPKYHSDRRIQQQLDRYSQQLANNVIVASVGSKGHNYDIAMDEIFDKIFQLELTYPKDPWRGLDDVAFATRT